MQETHLLYYKSKTLSELADILNDFSKLTLDSKRALSQTISELNSSGSLEEGKIEELNLAIQTDLSEINSLKYLNWIGIDFNEYDRKKIISKSNSANTRDFWATIIGVVLSLFLLNSVMLLVDLFSTKLELSLLVLFGIVTSIGIIGVLLLIKTIDRILFFKGFKILNQGNLITLYHRPKFKIKEIHFYEDARLELNAIDTNWILTIVDKANSVKVIKFGKLSAFNVESLKTLVERFNN